MTLERQVYLLDSQEYPPETIAVAFAKTSRSPESFRQIAAELNDQKSTEFNEKWVVGYGHASVAEHAVLHIAVENVSRLAVECIESNRLASYTEKSTRYQKWNADAFFSPPELEDHPLQPLYLNTIRRLFETYQQMLAPVRNVVAQHNPRRPEESEAAFDRRIRSDYVDVCRFLLPAASLANLGVTINARALEHALRKMLSHPLEEVRQVGAEIKRAADARLPALIKYVDRVPYLEESAAELTRAAQAVRAPADILPGREDWCRLVHFDPQAEERILAAALYRFGELSFQQALDYVRSAGPAEKNNLAEILLARLGPHDAPLREMEYADITLDLMIDQGGYFELKRHRMMTQTPQPLTTHLGYCVPRAVVEAGMEETYRSAMHDADAAFQQLASYNPAVAAYLVPNAYNRRVLLNINLRSALHLIALRAAPNAHFSMRRAARRIAEILQSSNPLLGRFLDLGGDETWQSIEASYFAETAARPAQAA